MAKTATDLRKSRSVSRSGRDGVYDLDREILDALERRAHLSEEEIVEEFPRYRDWKYDGVLVSPAQLQQLADFMYEPYNCFLYRPLRDDEVITDFRGAGGGGVVRKLVDLDPALRQRIQKSSWQQEWLMEYRVEKGVAKLDWLGSCSRHDTSPEGAAQILADLLENDRSEYWLVSEFLSGLVDAAEKLGVLIQAGNVVERWVNRPLDANLFSSFQLFDYFAPLIYVHSDTSNDAQLFVLVNALAHLLVGEAGVGLVRAEDVFELDDMELWCSSVALEYLVPKREVLEFFNPDHLSSYHIFEFANRFLVSPLLVIVRLKQLGLVDDFEFDQHFDWFSKVHYDTEFTNGRYFVQESHIREPGLPFAKAVAEYLYSDKINDLDAAEALDQPYSDVDRLYFNLQ